MKIAVVIGHDKISPGAYSKYISKSEYQYNREVASYLRCVDIYKRPENGSYKTQMETLAERVRPHNYDLIIELHFNMFDDIANNKGEGVETVSYPGNEKTIELGTEYCKLISKHYYTKNRGAKVANKGGRGWWFLELMPANAIIVEPFFGDELEAEKFSNEAEYAEIIMKWLKIE